MTRSEIVDQVARAMYRCRMDVWESEHPQLAAEKPMITWEGESETFRNTVRYEAGIAYDLISGLLEDQPKVS